MSNSVPAQGGNQNTATGVEVMDLTEDSLLERQKHEALLVDLEAKKRAFAVDVPTLPNDVRDALRSMGLPVRLFGENLANIRDRLKMELARRQVLQEGSIPSLDVAQEQKAPSVQEEEEQVTKYTRASPELIGAREQFAKFSLDRAQRRLDVERSRRFGTKRKRALLLSASNSSADAVVPSNPAENEKQDACIAEVDVLNEVCAKLYKSVRNLALEGSQYGDTRALSAICTSRSNVAGVPLVVTGSWSGTIKVWNGGSAELDLITEKTMAHEDRIMNVAIRTSEEKNVDSAMLATVSIDLSAKLWKIQASEDEMRDADDVASALNIQEAAHLKGHEARLSNVAFHPMGAHVATTSFDHTWRLWDVETGSELLLQDGHARETYGIGFHPDGSLCSTTDFGGVVQVWDLRTGKSVCHFLGHAKRVLCAEFSPNGFQLATAGDDGTIKIYDLRRKKQAASIPAHSNLISQLRFANSTNHGEYLASSSFDGTGKIWSTRDWKMLSTLRGHEGKVLGIDVLDDGVVTCGYDKTMKLWR